MKIDIQNETELELADSVRQACVKVARDGFQDASMSGLCKEGALEAAISAMQNLDVEELLKKSGR